MVLNVADSESVDKLPKQVTEELRRARYPGQ